MNMRFRTQGMLRARSQGEVHLAASKDRRRIEHFGRGERFGVEIE
jgi:hypothetical protein